jgi:hypothetical protein
MAKSPEELAHIEWLGYVQPVGLVVSIPAMLEAQCYVNKNIMAEHARFLNCLARDSAGNVQTEIRDLREFVQSVLGWESDDLISLPDRGRLPSEYTDLEVVLPQYHETLRPTHVVPEFNSNTDESSASKSKYVLLIQELASKIDLDEPLESDSAKHWNASPQAKFERLLREAGVPIGLLFNRSQFRLVYAPRGETSGYATFNVDEMAQVAGRPMFAALHMLLGVERLFSLADKQRLPYILENSRKYQNTVSTALAEQVTSALFELLRGFQAANDQRVGELLRHVLANNPQHVYHGLLTVLMRLVFVLYAEDRDLVSSDPTYTNHYSVSGLFERLRSEAGRFPDTMDQRFGAWAQLLTLFRLVYEGGQHAELKIPARKGYLFDPNRYPFLEGRFDDGKTDFSSAEEQSSAIQIPHISDGVIYRVLEDLLILDGERLSYRTLDVEQIGSVYEAIMGFELQVSAGKSIAIKPVKSHGAPATINLEALLAAKPADRAKLLNEWTDQKLGAGDAAALKEAATIDEVVAALDKKIAKHVTPGIVPADSMVFQPSDERRRSGSHYTPRSLTQPIVRTTLEPILKQMYDPEAPLPKVYKPTRDDKQRYTAGELEARVRLSQKQIAATEAARAVGCAHPWQILELKVCDPAMGSGAFLVETCRQLGDELIKAWYAHDMIPADIPPDEDEVLYARRTVAQRCLYGVDKNIMAVDLAKLSLWLVTLAKDHPFTFLDHAMRHGDSLVGLTREQIIGFHWEPKKQKKFGEDLIQRRLDRATEARSKILNAREDVAYRDQEQRMAVANEALNLIRLIGDACISCFFASNKKREREEELNNVFLNASLYVSSISSNSKAQTLLRFEEARDASNGNIDFRARESLNQAADRLRSLPKPLSPFHWEIEWPEVFLSDKGGFDAILGNPPFINAIDGGLDKSTKNWLQQSIRQVSGAADLAFYFLAKAHSCTKRSGSLGFLMPRIFLNAPAAEELRKDLIQTRPPLLVIAHDNSSLFDSANVFVVSTVFSLKGDCKVYRGPKLLDVNLSESNWWAAINGVESNDEFVRVKDVFTVASSMTTQIAYDIQPHLIEDKGEDFPRLVTTGLIDPFQCLWGKQTCRYLKSDYLRPVINTDDDLPDRVTKRLALKSIPKLLVAGVAGPGNRLEAFVDEEGCYVGAVSTYTITHINRCIKSLRALCEYLNSDEVATKVQSILSASAMGSGMLTIPKSFLQDLPFSFQVLTSED